jgi:hypothetical protein
MECISIPLESFMLRIVLFFFDFRRIRRPQALFDEAADSLRPGMDTILEAIVIDTVNKFLLNYK